MGLACEACEGTARRGSLYKDRPSMRTRVPSMLFDCEVDEACSSSSPGLDCDALDSVLAVRTLACPPIWALQVAADVKCALRELQLQQQQESSDDESHDDRSTSDTSSAPTDPNDTCLALAQALSARGHAVSIRHCLGGGSGGACLRNLRHSFLSYTPPHSAYHPRAPHAPCPPAALISCSASSPAGTSPPVTTSPLAGSSSPVRSSAGPKSPAANNSSGTRCIIDPCFREQFEIAHATPRYAAVLEALPAVYVGPEDRMPALVELLCSEMSMAFKTQDVLLPPWRQAKSMLSKWQPRRSLEEHVGISGRHVSARASSPHSGRDGSGDGTSSSGGSSDSRVSRRGSMGSSGSGRVVMEPWQRFVGGDFAVVEVTPTSPSAVGW